MNFLSDKSWMDIGYRLDPRYISGVESFLEFSLANTKRLTHGHIPCPCKKCRNTSIIERDIVYEHLMVNGILGDSRVWSRHGEIALPSSSNIITSTESCDDGVQDMIHDAFIIGDEDDEEDAFALAGEDEYAKNFLKLIEEREKPLHSGPRSSSKLKFLDYIWFTWRMKLLTGERGVAILYAYILLGLGFLRGVTPDFGDLESREQQLEGTFRFVHSRFREHADFYDGNSVGTIFSYARTSYRT